MFNFNPFNYYQTPNERYNAFFKTNYEINDHLEVYSTVQYTNVTVRQQIAPSGTFGASFDVPIANPFFSDSARATLLTHANAIVTADAALPADQQRFNSGSGGNWRDVNGNGVVDMPDYLELQLRRRTLELGPRSERYDSDYYSILFGGRGEIAANWEYDVYFQYGEANRTTVRAGYTNLTNIQNALDAVSEDECNNGDATCVPIDLFGGYLTITPAMALYAQALALQQQKYEQRIFSVSATGPIEFLRVPFADSSLSLSVGFESRSESGAFEPDECLKLAPASCQGGAGGNLLPIAGTVKVDEFFGEGFLPLMEDKPFAEQLALEFGYRYSDYNTVGVVSTFKFGVNWNPISSVLVRAMFQQATRAPNVAELFSPVTTGLDDAALDPCSIGNASNLRDADGNLLDNDLVQRCRDTGVIDTRIGRIQDIVSFQINTIGGSDPDNVPSAETANSFTAGVSWSERFGDLSLGVTFDFYSIDITDVIGEFSSQEILDGCYVAAVAIQTACDSISRVNGGFSAGSSGIILYTTNLEYALASGFDVGFNLGYNLGSFGDIAVTAVANYYLKNEARSGPNLPTVDCNGFFSSGCNPRAKLNWNAEVSWAWNALNVGIRWKHLGPISLLPTEDESNFFDDFENIPAFDYFDILASYSFTDAVVVRLAVDNVLNKMPPIVGDGAGSTAYNSGNTFPSTYDTIGRLYSLGLQLKL